MTEDRLEGSCTCGAVRFEGQPPSKFVAHCWCLNCRRAHGAAVVTWVGFPLERFRWTRGEANLIHYRTETEATRSFCRTCGSTLSYRSPRWPDDVHVTAGNLHSPPDRAPTVHVYADRAPEWFPIRDDLPRHGGEDGVQPLG